MKFLKQLIFTLALGLMVQAGYGQELGIRFGTSMGNKNSVAIDGVFALGKFSRIHGDVSFGTGVTVDVLWDFLYRPVGDEPIYWYVGAGPSLYLGSPFGLGASGEIGLEYKFNTIPLAFGVDWRPTFVIVETTDFVSGFGINLRYVFK